MREMSNEEKRVDKPEPRWQAVLAFVAVATIYLALPKNLILGPAWLVTDVNRRAARADSR